MLARLAVNDTSTALTAVSDGAQAKCSAIFTALQSSLPSVVSSLGVLQQPGSISEQMAQYIVLQPVNGSTQGNAFEVCFLIGDDGIWRVDGM